MKFSHISLIVSQLSGNTLSGVTQFTIIVIVIIFFFHGLGHLTCSGFDALTSFPGASTISSSSRFVVEGVFRESGVVHSFKMVDPVLFDLSFDPPI
jgi:hypothetical protein